MRTKRESRVLQFLNCTRTIKHKTLEIVLLAAVALATTNTLFVQNSFATSNISNHILSPNIYGKDVIKDDDRVEVTSVPEVTEQAQAVGLLLSKRSILISKNSTILKGIDTRSKFNIQGDGKFLDQPSFGTDYSCTGFLVSPTILATAAHCVRPNTENTKRQSLKKICEDTAIVFNLNVDHINDINSDKNSVAHSSQKKATYSTNKSSTRTKISLPTEQVRTCNKIIVPKKEVDLALIQLDRPANMQPLTLSSHGQAQNLSHVYSLGYPLAAPMKFTGHNPLLNIDETKLFFQMNVFRGSSGSPIFDSNTGQVSGILIQGAPDFSQPNRNSNQITLFDRSEHYNPTMVSEVALRLDQDWITSAIQSL